MEIFDANALKALENLARVKQREVVCPMTKMRAIVTPLLTSDDLALRTTISSPDIYDQELSNLIYRHTRFPEVTQEIQFVDFIDNLSYIDRQVIIWGIVNSTYGTLGTMNITCPRCGHQYTDEITAEQIFQDDTLTLWDNEVPFNQYIFPIQHIADIEGVYMLEFYTSIPTIRQHLDVLRLIPGEKIKENYDKFGTILSKTEELSSVVRQLKLYPTKDCEPEKVTVWNTALDIHMIINQFITLDITTAILDKYNEHFNKYVPLFRKPLTCPNCSNQFNYIADPEISLFRQFLRG